MSSPLPLPPREQLYQRYNSNKHTPAPRLVTARRLITNCADVRLNIALANEVVDNPGIPDLHDPEAFDDELTIIMRDTFTVSVYLDDQGN